MGSLCGERLVGHSSEHFPGEDGLLCSTACLRPPGGPLETICPCIETALVLTPTPTPLLSPDDFEALCNVLQRPSYGLGRPGSLGAPFEYGGGEFLPYGPDVYDPLARPGPLLPSYDALPHESLYGPSPYEAAGLDDTPYSDAQLETPAEDPRDGYQPRSPPDSDWHYPSRGRGHSYPERPSRASEDYREWVTKGEGGATTCMFAKRHLQVVLG